MTPPLSSVTCCIHGNPVEGKPHLYSAGQGVGVTFDQLLARHSLRVRSTGDLVNT